MFDWLFSSDLPLAARFAAAFVIVLVLFMAGAALVHRLRGRNPSGTAAGRGRQARLGVLDVLAIDSRRSLVIVRRDNVEHLIMIGGPNDVVVESAIVRGSGVQRELAPAVELGVRGEGARQAQAAGRPLAPQPRAGLPDTGPQRAAVRQEPAVAIPRSPPTPPVPQPQAQAVARPQSAPQPPHDRPAAPVPAPRHAEPPKIETPRVEAPIADAPRSAPPRLDAPRVDAPRVDAPRRGEHRHRQNAVAAAQTESSAAAPPVAARSMLRPPAPPIRGSDAPVPQSGPDDKAASPQHADPLFSDIAQRLEQALTSRPAGSAQPPRPAAPTQPASPPVAPVGGAPSEPRVRSAFDSLEEEMASLLGRDSKRDD